MTFLYRAVGQLVQKMKRVDTHRQYGGTSSKLRGFLQGKCSETQTCNIVKFFVCLSVAFKFLNRVTLLQMWCEHYDDLGRHHDD